MENSRAGNAARLRAKRAFWLRTGAASAILSAAFAAPAAAQATIDNPAATAAQIGVRLDGAGVTISNASIPAANNSDTTTMYGLFSNGTGGAGFTINTGVVLSTGTVADMMTANDQLAASIGSTTQYSDPQLTAIEPNATRNVAVVTMDVTLDAGVTGLEMRYQFGSEEYPDYVGSTFNDLFAILLSGPGITGVENIALLPGGDRTDVDSVNFGLRGCNQNGAPIISGNNTFYVNNGHTTTVNGTTGYLNCNTAPQPGPFPMIAEWNGATTALTARRLGLTPGGTYTLKIAVADVLDKNYDSAAIFEVIRGVFSTDYGDAPNTGGYGDPFHTVVAGMRLGNAPTLEANGYNSPTATGDVDNGVTLASLSSGNLATLNVNAIGAGGFLQAWIDWTDDGDFNDAGEQIATNLQDSDGDNWITVSVTPPSTATAYDTIARFRWSTQSGLNATASAANGEVEDYLVTVNPAAGAYMCPAGMTPVSQSGNASAVISTPPGATNPNLALGPIMPAGAGLGAANAARLSSATSILGLDLAQIIPQNAPITLSVALDDAAGVMAIDTSIDGTSWTQQLTFNSGAQDLAQRITLTTPAGGARYLRFRRTAGNLWVDGVTYASVCQGVPELQGAKSIMVYDPLSEGLYALPGEDVIYSLTVTNTGAVATNSNSVVLIDKLPAEVEVFTGTTPEFGGQIVGFTQTGASMIFTPGTDLAWSDSTVQPTGFAQCTYPPAPGYDPLIKFVCLNPKGVLPAGNPDPIFTLKLRARIK